MTVRKMLTAAALILAFAGQNLNMVYADAPTITDVCWTSEADKHIKDEEGLRHLAHLVNVHGSEFENETIYLEDDISLSAEPFTPIGTLDHPFKGNFDGGGHSISGMNITDIDGVDCYGLFGVTLEGSISSVKLYDVNINITKEPQAQQNTICVGSLSGISGNCDIMMCSAESGSITGVKNTEKNYQSDAGGLFGILLGGNTRFCRNNVSVTANFDTVGGLAGALAVTDGNYGENVAYCCNNADIKSDGTHSFGSGSFVGGLAGANTGGSIRSSYNSGHVVNESGTDASGLVVTSNSTASVIENCIDLCPENINKTSNAGTLSIIYTSDDYKLIPASFDGNSGEKLEYLDLKNLSELEIMDKVNSYESNYVWGINYGHPVLWWQAINGNDAVIRGDVTGDGYLAPRDISLILKHIGGISALTGDRLLCADYNADGNIDLTDAILIMNNHSRYFSYITT